MAFDIYGNYLRPGYCEVHPDVREEWPCSECYESYESYVRQCEQQYDEEERREYEDRYYEGLHLAAVADCAGPGVDARPIIVIDAPGRYRILPSHPRP
jgi:hypothetical protein